MVLFVMVVGKMPFTYCQKKEEYTLNTRMRDMFMRRLSKGLMQDNWELMENLTQGDDILKRANFFYVRLNV